MTLKYTVLEPYSTLSMSRGFYKRFFLTELTLQGIGLACGNIFEYGFDFAEMGQKSEKFTMVKTKKSCDTVPLRTRVSELEEKKNLICWIFVKRLQLTFIWSSSVFYCSLVNAYRYLLTIFEGFQLCYSLFLVLGSSNS